jgi:hypothetical protein
VGVGWLVGDLLVVAVGLGEDLVDVPVGVAVAEDRCPQRGGVSGVVVAQGERGSKDGVVWVVGAEVWAGGDAVPGGDVGPGPRG